MTILPRGSKPPRPANATTTANGTARTSTALTRAKFCWPSIIQAAKFSLLNFIRSQTELCRVLVRATNFPYLKRYPMLVLKNPVAEKEGVAGYEIALNLNGVAFALMPRAESEIKSRAKFQLLSVNEAEEKANPCRHLVVQRNGRWQLADEGLRELELLTY